jgi:hypothetical protein
MRPGYLQWVEDGGVPDPYVPPEPVPPPVDQAARANLRIDAGITAAVAALPTTKLMPAHGVWPAYSVHQNATQSILRNVATKIKFSVVEYDVTAAFDLVNSRFKPVVAGYYQISCGCGANTGADMYTSIYKNGTEYRRATTTSLGNSRLSTLVHLNGTTDYVEGYALSTSSNFTTTTGVVMTSFSGVLVQPETLPYETQERVTEIAAAVKAMLEAHAEQEVTL